MFELFYSTGGHGGPYKSFGQALGTAIDMLYGNCTEHYIDIVNRENGNTTTRISRVPSDAKISGSINVTHGILFNNNVNQHYHI